MTLPAEPDGGPPLPARPAAPSEAKGAAPILLILLLTLIWGTAFPAIKVAVTEMPVLTFRAVCLVLGAAGVAALAISRGRSLAVTRRQFGWLAVLGTFNSLGWNLFTAYGLLYLPAGRAIIIGYTMPLWTVIAAAFILGEPITTRKVIGLCLGFAGLAVLIGPDLLAIGQAPLGVGLVLAAAVSWAIGVVLMKWDDLGLPTTVLAAWQLGIAAVPLIVAALIFDDYSWQLSSRGWFAVAFVSLVAMVFAHLLWFSLVRTLPASVASISTLLIPVTGVIVSALWLGERVGYGELAALVLVLSGLFVVLVMPALGRKPAGGD